MNTSPAVATDILIFGGGIAGLWTLHRLRRAGFAACLLESSSLGSTQSIGSQGIIHGGLGKLDIPLLSFDEGNAKMWDAPAENGALDGVIDRIDDGFWIAQVKGGSKMAYPFMGLRKSNATPTR